MGSSESTLLCKHRVHSQEWRNVQNTLNSQLFQNTITMDLCENTKMLNIEGHRISIYQSRRLYSYLYTPKIIDFSVLAGAQTKSLPNRLAIFSIDVLVEATQNRLSGISKTDSTFLLKLLSQSLMGFKYLFCKYGPFRIRSDQIGWTRNKIAKVWINPDFASNQKNASNASESTMLKEIFHIFGKLLGSDLPIGKINSFDEAVRLVPTFKNQQELRKARKQKIKTLELKMMSKVRGRRSRSLCQTMENGISLKLVTNNNQPQDKFFPWLFKKDYIQQELPSPLDKDNNGYASHKSFQVPQQQQNSSASKNASVISNQSQKWTFDSFHKKKQQPSQRTFIEEVMTKVTVVEKLQTQKQTKQNSIAGFQTSFGSKASDTSKQHYALFSSKKSINLPQNQMKFFANSLRNTQNPYQSSSSKIPVLRKSSKVSQSCKKNKSFDTESNSDVLTNKVQKIKNLLGQQKMYNQIPYGLSRQMTSEQLLNQVEKIQKQKLQSKVGPVNDIGNKIFESQLQNDLDQLFMSQREIDRTGDTDEYEDMRQDLATILNFE